MQQSSTRFLAKAFSFGLPLTVAYFCLDAEASSFATPFPLDKTSIYENKRTTTENGRYKVKTSVAFCDGNSKFHSLESTLSPTTASGKNTENDCDAESIKKRKSHAMEYYKQHGVLPKPPVVHATLPSIHNGDNAQDTLFSNDERKKILVVGDIHGCFDELKDLHERAVRDHNGGMPFEYVISVGDLVNKGPKSVEVVQHFRTSERWLAIRGNHDDGALRAAFGDEKRLSKRKYQWIKGLSDEDIVWMSDLPYSIRIPRTELGQDENIDTLIVHAGLIPKMDLEKQTIETMITIREVDFIENEEGAIEYLFSKRNEKQGYKHKILQERSPWASVWKGPFRIIFGHDAKRGLQRYEGEHDWAIGLDTGCCYGKKLTGIILPERTLVQVDAKEIYCPINE